MFVQFDLLKEHHFLSVIENNSGGGGSGYVPTWDRGANLKDYYSRKEEQEVQAVRLYNPVLHLLECDLGLGSWNSLKYLQLYNLVIVLIN